MVRSRFPPIADHVVGDVGRGAEPTHVPADDQTAPSAPRILPQQGSRDSATLSRRELRPRTAAQTRPQRSRRIDRRPPRTEARWPGTRGRTAADAVLQFDEEAAPSPSRPYGASRWVLTHLQPTGLHGFVVRLTPHTDLRRASSSGHQNALEGSVRVPDYGPGTWFRDLRENATWAGRFRRWA